MVTFLTPPQTRSSGGPITTLSGSSVTLQGSVKEVAGNQDTLSVSFPPSCNEGGDTLTAPTLLEAATRRKRRRVVEAMAGVGGRTGVPIQLGRALPS